MAFECSLGVLVVIVDYAQRSMTQFIDLEAESFVLE